MNQNNTRIKPTENPITTYIIKSHLSLIHREVSKYKDRMNFKFTLQLD